MLHAKVIELSLKYIFIQRSKISLQITEQYIYIYIYHELITDYVGRYNIEHMAIYTTILYTSQYVKEPLN